MPRAGYILADFDRVHPWTLEAAGFVYERLTREGLSILNNPRNFMHRAALLRRLKARGVNAFTCWQPAQDEWPDRFPVFLRTIHAHRGTESDLLHSIDDAKQALDRAKTDGKVLSDLVFVEYCAQPEPGTQIFRKHAAHFVNGKIIRGLTVTDSGWQAKLGELGLATEENYLADLVEQREYPHTRLMQDVAKIAGLEYGRIDYGMVDGKPQIYEVNSNPMMKPLTKHSSQTRVQTDKEALQALVAELSKLAPAQRGGSISMKGVIPGLGWRDYRSKRP
ncbi:ATP-grasp domain-containing protein [Actibacterium pelagium]|uniref:hypothetical protein n=1 Tax=Actibacterium pelagium TaxID=2029103 RepID=UPI000BAB0BE0|nr:hypothetical protein [Actibacterium pelagium]